jgi:hypothetical protein
LKTKLFAALAVAAIGGAFMATPAHAAPLPPIDVSNHSVACDSLVGSIKFGTALVPGGTSPNTITIKATLDGCDDLDDVATDNTNTVSIAPSKVSGTLNSTTNDCQGLVGPSTGTTGPTITSWKTNAKELGTGLPYPKIYDSVGGIGLAGKAATTMTVTQTFGGTYTATWGAGYGFFQIGPGFTTAPVVTGAFTGGNAGAGTVFEGTTGQSTTASALACFGKGIKLLNFGIGHVGVGL